MAFSAMYLLDVGMVSGRLSGYRFVPPAFGTGCCEKIRCAFHFGMLSFHLLLDFVTGLFGLLTHLGMITLRRFFLPGRSQWRFVLNHAGLWLALFAGFIGSAEEQTLRIPVFRTSSNNEAFTEEGNKVYLEKSLQLTDFVVEHYPNGSPRHFLLRSPSMESRFIWR